MGIVSDAVAAVGKTQRDRGNAGRLACSRIKVSHRLLKVAEIRLDNALDRLGCTGLFECVTEEVGRDVKVLRSIDGNRVVDANKEVQVKHLEKCVVIVVMDITQGNLDRIRITGVDQR